MEEKEKTDQTTTAVAVAATPITRMLRVVPMNEVPEVTPVRRRMKNGVDLVGSSQPDNDTISRILRTMIMIRVSMSLVLRLDDNLGAVAAAIVKSRKRRRKRTTNDRRERNGCPPIIQDQDPTNNNSRSSSSSSSRHRSIHRRIHRCQITFPPWFLFLLRMWIVVVVVVTTTTISKPTMRRVGHWCGMQ